MLNHRDQITALAVGNSHSRALELTILGFSGYHVWQGGNDTFETEYQLKKLIPLLPSINTVFFSAPYFLFHLDNGAIPERSEIRRRYYYVLSAKDWIKGDFTNYVLAKFSPIIRTDHWKDVLYRFADRNRINPADSNTESSVTTDGRYLSQKVFQHLDLNALIQITKSDRGVARHMTLVKQSINGNNNVAEDSLKSVEQSIQYLQKRNIRVIFYTPPFFYLYTELFDKNIIQLMKSNMEYLKKKYGIEYYDFSTNKEFIHNNMYFMDDDHLNLSYGSIKFSKEFKALIDSRREAVE